jgi:hypothetical protein
MFNLTLSPAQIEIVVKPGTTLTQAYEVTNEGESPLVISTSVLPWVASGTDGSIQYDNVPTNSNFNFSLANADLRLGESFVLKPQESRQIVLKVKTATESLATDGYFTFFVNQDQSGQLNSDITGGQATARVGSNILFSIANTEKPVSKITANSVVTSSKILDVFFPKIIISGEVSNQSEYFSKINGQLIISKADKVIKEGTLFPDNVLAHHSRQISCLSENLPIPCDLKAPYWPGKYTATISIEGGGSTSANFYVFPFSIIIFLLLIIGVGYLIKRQVNNLKKV